jgi:hypothetical protein
LLGGLEAFLRNEDDVFLNFSLRNRATWVRLKLLDLFFDGL